MLYNHIFIQKRQRRFIVQNVNFKINVYMNKALTMRTLMTGAASRDWSTNERTLT